MREQAHEEGGDASFTLGAYLRDKTATLIIGCVATLGVFWMCLVLGVGTDAACTVAAFVLICLCLGLAAEYVRKRRFWLDAQDAAASQLGACITSTLLPEATFLEGRLASDLAQSISDQANEELSKARTDAESYREYVELWIHEAKTPIAAAKLILDRMNGPDADALERELERMDNQVEQALYYARSTALQNDYAIRPVKLTHAAREACKRQARFLIENQAIPSVEMAEEREVLSDEPWLVFMLGQLLVNAARYGAHHITLTAHEEAPNTSHGRTVLTVADDGCGISEADLPRVFDRGFTGSNGRQRGSATGMGLYLVALMSQQLGLGVTIASEEGVGTRVMLAFPHDRSRS